MYQMSPPRPLIWLIALLLTSISISNAQFSQNENTTEAISLRSITTVLLAGQKNYSFEEIRDNPSLNFVPLSGLKENLGFSNDNYWLKFSLHNTADEFEQYYLETARPITDVVNLYLVDGTGDVQKQFSGDKIPFSKKTVQHRKSIFDIELKPNQKVTAYINLKSDGEVVMLPMDLYREGNFFNLTYKEQVFYGFFYGILVLASIIYLFFFFALKDKAFVYYACYVLFIALMQFSLDGFFHQYFTPEGGWLSDRAVLLTALTSLFFFGKYGDVYLNLKRNSPILHITNNIMGASIIIGMLILALSPNFEYCYPLANGIGILVLLQMIVSLATLKLKKVPVDSYFVIGISFLVLGFVVFILNNFNTIENSFFTSNGTKFGIGLEIIFLSISMSNRIRDLRMENEQNQLLALQRAEDMNEIKSSFLSNISHELRTPLNLIMGVATSLQENKEEENLDEKCKMLLSSSKNLLGNIEDILDFTVIEKGNQELQEVPFDLNSTLTKILKSQEKKALAKGLEFNISISDNLPSRIVGDKAKLAQILNHLLDNAIKFTNKGKVEVEVLCTRNGENKASIRFNIKDTGIGISKEKMSTIFESFTKKSFMDKREYSGLGLGLYIAKTYVDLQSGTIDLRQNTDLGTTCELTLNFEIDEDQIIVDEESKVETPFNREIGNILYVEDNKMNQTVVKLLFKKNWANANLTIANHGKEALEIMKEQSFDIILMDLQMPEMDGFETTSIIRNGQANCDPKVPIIVLTADNTSSTRKKIFELGANDLVTKPVNGPLLFSKMSKNALNKAIGKVA
ncbi:7TM diverse intracellular signaling domain-containing protein [Flagellimonas abyssi]|uniref:histidine kinase n=1 Tax=Flagellimonas abyssi TaxID=2864871 RepID=A0ABS7ERI4_9FLAO|nr:7TM diverse intracellular signaling domain-containing protein [Allomuricauda abyssi]MBC72020.1 hybrid sensor histidine kinase/response regulator [Allomuricauda sp.]MBW8200202.1 response regulator [Allomuricauda abyssi]